MACMRLFTALIMAKLFNDLIITVSFNVAIHLKLNIKKRTKVQPLCKTEDCNKTANELLNYMDRNADPCQDFYKFVCGKFLTKKLPKGRVAISTFSMVNDKLGENLKSVLGEGLSEAKHNFVKQTKLSYTSCMDTSSIEEEGVEAVKTKILGMFGGWPLLEGDNWNEEEHDLTQLLTKLQMYKVLGLFEIIFHNVDPSSNCSVPTVFQPTLSLPPDYYVKGSPKAHNVDALRDLILNISLYLGQIEKNPVIVNDVDGIVKFEIEISKCLFDEGIPEEQQQLLTTLNKLKTKFEKSFDFEAFFISMFDEVDVDIKPNETVGTIGMPYLSCLARLLENTSKKKIVNYLIWKVVHQSKMAMPSQVEEFSRNFLEVVEGSRKDKPRWYNCVNYVNNYLHRSVGYLYITKEARYVIKSGVFKMIQKLKAAFTKLLKRLTWMNKNTKQQAIVKLRQMVEQVAYPDGLDKTELLDAEFNGIDFSRLTFADVFFAVRIMIMKKEMRTLRIPNSPSTLEMPIAMVNAFYDFYVNRIVFPAGILETPFYSEAYPLYLNLGGIGFFIGHEIIHGFDNTGSQFDYRGAKNNWWEPDDRVEFLNRSQCFVNQYNNLILEEIAQKVNGKLTLGENIADSGGLRIAHMAYKSWLRKNGEEKQLVGLPYNSEQMFFIGFARNFCQKVTPEIASINIKTDNHAPNKFRVNIPLKSFKAFATAFHCNKKTEMRSNKRCRVW